MAWMLVGTMSFTNLPTNDFFFNTFFLWILHYIYYTEIDRSCSIQTLLMAPTIHTYAHAYCSHALLWFSILATAAKLNPVVSSIFNLFLPPVGGYFVVCEW